MLSKQIPKHPESQPKQYSMSRTQASMAPSLRSSSLNERFYPKVVGSSEDQEDQSSERLMRKNLRFRMSKPRRPIKWGVSTPQHDLQELGVFPLYVFLVLFDKNGAVWQYWMSLNQELQKHILLIRVFHFSNPSIINTSASTRISRHLQSRPK